MSVSSADSTLESRPTDGGVVKVHSFVGHSLWANRGEAQKIKLTIKKARYLFIIKVSYIDYLIITKYPIPSNLG
jgi:hypothetical protein